MSKTLTSKEIIDWLLENYFSEPEPSDDDDHDENPVSGADFLQDFMSLVAIRKD